MKIKWLSFRIREQYMNRIIPGVKTVEYRKHSDFWHKRLDLLKGKLGTPGSGFIPLPLYGKWDNPHDRHGDPFAALFLCRKIMHRREVWMIERVKTPDFFSEQGKKDVNTETCYGFFLGHVLVGNEGLLKQEFYNKYSLQNETCYICGEGLKLDTLGSVIFLDHTGREIKPLVACNRDLEQMKIQVCEKHKLLEVLA